MAVRRSGHFVLGLCAIVLCGVIAPLPVQPASLTNRDVEDRKLTVIGGKGRTSTVLNAGASITGFCIGGCTIKIDGFDDIWSLEGNELVSIEGGKLYYDGEDKSDAAKPSTGAK